MTDFVAYYRVSTKRQGDSGLGLEAQRADVDAYLAANPGRLVAEFTEVESGAKSAKAERPQLHEALDICGLYGATLVVAKLDRLSRSAAFLTALQETGVKFVCCDFPQADHFVIGIMAMVARWERERTSERTKAALAARKARGAPHNGYRPSKGCGISEEARQRGRQVRIDRANARAEQYRSTFAQLQAEGINSLRAQTFILNERGIPLPNGDEPKPYGEKAIRTRRPEGKGSWNAIQVRRLRERLGIGPVPYQQSADEE